MFFDPSMLINYLILALNIFLIALFIIKYIKNDLQSIFKIILEVQVLALIAFAKNSQKCSFKT